MIKGLYLLFIIIIISALLISSTYAQKVPFPEDWEQAAGPIPEAVPETDNRGAVNVALLPLAKANASSVIPGWEKRHNISFLNDGWYNNPRSWIPAKMPAWAEIDLGKVYDVDKVVFGSEHTARWKDRAITEFAVLVATEYNLDSTASTWKEVFTYKGDPIRDTTPFTFKSVNARWVRIDIRAGESEPRIDELEIYSFPMSTSVNYKDRLSTTWGKIKCECD